MFWPCETRTSTCRNFATISSGLYRFLAITVLLDVRHIPQVGPLQWGWLKAMKRISVATVLLSGLCVLLPMPKSFAQPVAGDQIEPKAGSWQTWVISSGREFRAAPPPNDAATAAEIDELKSLANKRDAAAMDVIAYWNVGPPSYRWHEIALSEAMRNNLSWNFAIRHFALLHVAIYDALVAAWDSKYEN